MRNLSPRYRFMFPLLFIAAALLFSAIVMALWNAILPAVTGVKEINYIQAMGILLLSKILFGGFRGGHGHYQWNKMNAKWQDMTPEEREKFKTEWKNRCWKRKENISEIKSEEKPDVIV